jgi:hypothetical protein
MYASLRLMSAAERLRLPTRRFVRGRLFLLLLPTMRGIRETFDYFSEYHIRKLLHRCARGVSGHATVMLPEKLDEFPPPSWDLFPWPKTTLLKLSTIFEREPCAASQ